MYHGLLKPFFFDKFWFLFKMQAKMLDKKNEKHRHFCAFFREKKSRGLFQSCLFNLTPTRKAMLSLCTINGA